jgi:hypothetical protein
VAREQANVRLSIWTDPDFRALSCAAQHMYLLILTSPTLSYAGVADWRPKRIAALAAGWSADAVEIAAAELHSTRFLIVDPDTDEALVRSFLKHDGLMAREFMATAAAKAYEGVASPRIRGVIVHELQRLRRDEPSLLGWNSKRLLAVLEDPSVDPSEVDPREASAMPSAMPFGDPSGEPHPEAKREASVEEPPTTTTSTTTSTDSAEIGDAAASDRNPERYSEAFEAAWAAYERRGAKRKAFAEWKRAVKRADPATIVEAIPRYIAANRDPRYRLHFERYLSGDVWESVPGGPGGEVLPPHLHRDHKTGRLVER